MPVCLDVNQYCMPGSTFCARFKRSVSKSRLYAVQVPTMRVVGSLVVSSRQLEPWLEPARICSQLGERAGRLPQMAVFLPVSEWRHNSHDLDWCRMRWNTLENEFLSANTLRDACIYIGRSSTLPLLTFSVHLHLALTPLLLVRLALTRTPQPPLTLPIDLNL